MKIDLDEWSFNVLGSVEISKGKFSHPCLTLIEVTDSNASVSSYKLIEHTKVSYPTRSSLVRLTEAVTKDYTWRTISKTEGDILGDAMVSWDIDKCNTLMCYSYLYAYCRAKCLDLHEDLYLKQ